MTNFDTDNVPIDPRIIILGDSVSIRSNGFEPTSNVWLYFNALYS